MEVTSVLVDDIGVGSDGVTASVVASLYEFPEPRWVTVHPERGNFSVGPLALVQPHMQQREPIVPVFTTHNFGARTLRLDQDKTRSISYRETWTVPDNCVYALVLPQGYAATQLIVEREGYPYQPTVEIAVSPERRVFHYVVLMGERGSLQVQTRLSFDEEKYRHVIESADTVEATNKYAELRKSLRDNALSIDFWFKLLTYGSKLLGGS